MKTRISLALGLSAGLLAGAAIALAQQAPTEDPFRPSHVLAPEDPFRPSHVLAPDAPDLTPTAGGMMLAPMRGTYPPPPAAGPGADDDAMITLRVPATAQLSGEEQALEREVRELLAQLRPLVDVGEGAAAAEDRAKRAKLQRQALQDQLDLSVLARRELESQALEKRLHDLLGRQFDARHARQRGELERLEAEVGRLRDRLERRRERRGEIIEFRAQQLIRYAQGLGWEGEAASPAGPRQGNDGSGMGMEGSTGVGMGGAVEPVADARRAIEGTQSTKATDDPGSKARDDPIDGFVSARLHDIRSFHEGQRRAYATFFRRLNLDLFGVVPSDDERRRFLAGTGRDRVAGIDALIARAVADRDWTEAERQRAKAAILENLLELGQ